MSRGEKPCEACKAAKAAYDKRWRSAPEVARRNRASARAQYLAVRDLKQAHEEEYQALYQRHRAEVFRDLGLD